jgi:hypothetical protein
MQHSSLSTNEKSLYCSCGSAQKTGGIVMFLFEREYGKLDYGNAPLDKFDNKPVLVVTGAKSAKLQKSQGALAEPHNPSTAEPAPASLPRTASPLPALGLAGLLSLTLGLGLPLLGRQ